MNHLSHMMFGLVIVKASTQNEENKNYGASFMHKKLTLKVYRVVFQIGYNKS
jgi:hypothetical protein